MITRLLRPVARTNYNVNSFRSLNANKFLSASVVDEEQLIKQDMIKLLNELKKNYAEV